MYFRQAWRDPRLSFQPIYNKTEIRLHDGSWDDFWIPDTAACVLLVLPVPGGYDDLPRVNPTRPVARESGRVGSGRRCHWIPDTYFRNEKRAAFHRVTMRNRMLKLNSTGHLWYVSRYASHSLTNREQSPIISRCRK